MYRNGIIFATHLKTLKMKKITVIVFALTSVFLASCGGGGNDAAREQAIKDSLAQVERQKAIDDSIAAANAPKDIVETAINAGKFSTLAKALETAGLVETLKGTGPFTVFAPTDAAFSALPKGTLDNLMKPGNEEALRNVLLYHVVEGKLMASDVASVRELTTVNGSSARISSSNGKVMIDKAEITETDIECSNGEIHVINAVILPPRGAANRPNTTRNNTTKKDEPKKDESKTGTTIDLNKGKDGGNAIDLNKGKTGGGAGNEGQIDLSKGKKKTN